MTATVIHFPDPAFVAEVRKLAQRIAEDRARDGRSLVGTLLVIASADRSKHPRSLALYEAVERELKQIEAEGAERPAHPE